MKNENYINIQGWMVNQLKLKGSKLSLYALIFGFSQDGVNEYKASFKYISKSIGVSESQAKRIVKELVEEGLILKTKGDSENSNTYKYNPSSIMLPPLCQNATTPSSIMLPPYNNIYINNNNNNKPKGLETSVETLDNGSLSKSIETIKTPSSAAPLFGNPEVSKIIADVKLIMKIEDFKESKKMQRIWANHLVNLKNKLGGQEFSSRFYTLYKDEFHRKNMGSLAYIYKQIKGFVPTQNNTITQF